MILIREELFRLITENAADMIAVVGVGGERLYNSPSHERILGYTPNEITGTLGFEQVHPDDQVRWRD
jgi:PAS domain S-box-containing protein